MKYYLIQISEGDAKIKGKAIYDYEDRTLAIADFHSKLGTAMKSELYTKSQLLVLNSAGGIEAQEIFEREILENNAADENAVEEQEV